MSIKLREAIVADAQALTEVYMAAFSTSPISLRIFPRTLSSYTFWYERMSKALADPEVHIMLAYDEKTLSSPIAYCKWGAPTSKPLSGASDLPQWPEGADHELANQFFGTLSETRKQNMGERKHWYLDVLATLPKWQGKGVGGKLLGWGLEKADAEGVEAYLEASPAGKRLYEKMGFREIGKMGIPPKEVGGEVFVECFMLRDARNASV